MAYDNTSTHPLAALVRGSGEGDAPADTIAEQLERDFHTDDASAVQLLNLPNTVRVILRDDDGGQSVFVYDADETSSHDGVNFIEDSTGRCFVVTERTLTQAQYDALTPHSKTFYFITA